MVLEAFTTPIREVIEKAQFLLGAHFQTNIVLENVSQLSEPDRRNAILRLHWNMTIFAQVG